jgi:hypothetical protein
MMPVGGDGERGEMGEHAKSGSTMVAPICGGEVASISAPVAMAREMWPAGRRGTWQRKEMGSGGNRKKPAVRLLDEKNQRGHVLDEEKTGRTVVDENKPTECTLVENGTP